MPLPRKFLNENEEILVELRPHWVFFVIPLLVAFVAVAGVIALLSAVSMPHWAADALLILAAIPVAWCLGRLLRWRCYTLALTTTRIVVCRGVISREIVQVRLQRITEISLSQKFWERMLATGRLIVDVQGEDDAVVLEFVRKPAIVQRVINGKINELTTGALAEEIPDELRDIDSRLKGSGTSRGQVDDTPPFGVPAVAAQRPPSTAPPPTTAAPPPAASPPPATATPPAGGAGPGEIRIRLIELDDLRQRGIISEQEFAAKKAELLSRI
jgi:membrane protein YdbS with pleckstrin-like domain